MQKCNSEMSSSISLMLTFMICDFMTSMELMAVPLLAMTTFFLSLKRLSTNLCFRKTQYFRLFTRFKPQLKSSKLQALAQYSGEEKLWKERASVESTDFPTLYLICK